MYRVASLEVTGWVSKHDLLLQGLQRAAPGACLLENLAAVLGANVAGAVAALPGVEGLPKMRQQHRSPALHLLLAVCDLQSP